MPELRHAIEGMMKQNVEDADERRKRFHHGEGEDVENVDPYIKKIKTVEIDDEEILKVKAEQTSAVVRTLRPKRLVLFDSS